MKAWCCGNHLRYHYRNHHSAMEYQRSALGYQQYLRLVPSQLSIRKTRMYGLAKFLWHVIVTFRDLLNVDRNALQSVPTPTKYLAMIMLSLFWCLAFGLYVGEQLFIATSMLGHIALVTMAFVTWWLFRHLRTTYFRPMTLMRHEFELLRDPARGPKCYDMTEQERLDAIMRLSRNVWNDPGLAAQDQPAAR